jgi:hypothetical protein
MARFLLLVSLFACAAVAGGARALAGRAAAAAGAEASADAEDVSAAERVLLRLEAGAEDRGPALSGQLNGAELEGCKDKASVGKKCTMCKHLKKAKRKAKGQDGYFKAGKGHCIKADKVVADDEASKKAKSSAKHTDGFVCKKGHHDALDKKELKKLVKELKKETPEQKKAREEKEKTEAKVYAEVFTTAKCEKKHECKYCVEHQEGTCQEHTNKHTKKTRIVCKKAKKGKGKKTSDEEKKAKAKAKAEAKEKEAEAKKKKENK